MIHDILKTKLCKLLQSSEHLAVDSHSEIQGQGHFQTLY
jgi:hypothetical protein